MSQEPISPNTAQAYRATLDVNSSPSFIETSLPLQPVAVVADSIRDILVASNSVSGIANATIFTGTGRGQWVNCLILACESSTAALATITIRGNIVHQARIYGGSAANVTIPLTKPIFVNAGDAVILTSNSAGMNASGTIHYFDK